MDGLQQDDDVCCQTQEMYSPVLYGSDGKDEVIETKDNNDTTTDNDEQEPPSDAADGNDTTTTNLSQAGRIVKTISGFWCVVERYGGSVKALETAGWVIDLRDNIVLLTRSSSSRTELCLFCEKIVERSDDEATKIFAEVKGLRHLITRSLVCSATPTECHRLPWLAKLNNCFYATSPETLWEKDEITNIDLASNQIGWESLEFMLNNDIPPPPSLSSVLATVGFDAFIQRDPLAMSALRRLCQQNVAYNWIIQSSLLDGIASNGISVARHLLGQCHVLTATNQKITEEAGKPLRKRRKTYK